jgi:hypothetical protein
MKSLTYVEIDVPAWSQSSPDSPANELTFRFAVDTGFLPADIECIPSIKSVSISPSIVGLGSDLGQRASVTVTFKDHRHIFASEEFEAGTFWGKWRARYGLTLRGHAFRLIRGTLGQTLDEMETRQFTIEASDGPNATGEYKLIAKDVLKFADGDRAQAPLLSEGRLLTAITNSDTSATLTPTGAGSDYPPTGFVAIGGNEVASYSRSGDTLTLTRGAQNTTAVAHDAGDRVQICLDLTAGDTVESIIATLLQDYADIPSEWIPIAEWEAEVVGHLNVNFSALICEPTSVNKLLNELIEQASLALWWDDVDQVIKLQVLRAVAGATTIDMDTMLAGSLEITEQPDKRLSQVYVYFGKINPLVKEDQIDNYRSTVLQQDAQAEVEYGTAAIKKIYSRWIPSGGRATAELIANKHLGRFRDPPRRFGFDLLRYAQTDPQLGAGYFLESWQLQDTSGNAASVPIQVFRLNPAADRFEVEAEEMLWTPYGGDIDPTTKAIIFDAHEANVNVRTRHDQLYPAPQSGQTINVYVQAIVIYSHSTSLPAMDIGTWPGGVTINLIVTGWIRGKGGNGGNGGSLTPGPFATDGTPGTQGGTALYTRQAINLTSTNGHIWGGGGGGGGGGAWAVSSGGFGSEVAGSGGGTGSGTDQGVPGAGGTASIGFQSQTQGEPGSLGDFQLGGAGGNKNYAISGSAPGGDGGTPGVAGSAGTTPAPGGTTSSGGAGGAAGIAIDGDSFVTDIGGVGDILGTQVN